MNTNDPFDDFIIDSGLSDYYKSELDLKLSLYHDLGIYGDIAESFLETLRSNYNVDISAFIYQDYFPEEFYGKSQFQKILFSFIPFLSSKAKNNSDFKPLTFLMIKNAIREGRLE